MAFSIRLTEQERQLAENYARLHSMSIGEAFKQALFEKIEDEFDLRIFNKALADYENDPETFTFDEVMRELEL